MNIVKIKITQNYILSDLNKQFISIISTKYLQEIQETAEAKTLKFA